MEELPPARTPKIIRLACGPIFGPVDTLGRTDDGPSMTGRCASPCPVVFGQRGPVNLCHRPAKGALLARLESHVSLKVATVERSADGLGRSSQAPIQYRGALAAREIEVGEVDDNLRLVQSRFGVGDARQRQRGNDDHAREAIHSDLLCVETALVAETDVLNEG